MIDRVKRYGIGKKWREFNVVDLLEKKKSPRVLVRRFFKINAEGEIKWFDHKKIKWRPYPIHMIKGEPHFVTIIGSNGIAVVKLKIKVKDLVDRYFSI